MIFRLLRVCLKPAGDIHDEPKGIGRDKEWGYESQKNRDWQKFEELADTTDLKVVTGEHHGDNQSPSLNHS